MDISESCGYTIQQQIKLFSDIKPLFANKPHLLVLTKVDIMPYESLNPETRKLIEAFVAENKLKVIHLSNFKPETIFQVKQSACDILLDFRMRNEDKNVSKNKMLKMEEDYLKGITIIRPSMKRDGKSREAFQFDLTKNEGEKGPTVKDLQDEHGGAGVFYMPIEGKARL